MAASSADKFKKGARKWVGQIGAGGVADDTAATIPLASSTGLPTDTGVVAVIDRVDASGTKTPLLEETVIGVVSGDNLVTSVRGAEGTAQAHSAGAVVEILITNKGWNDMVDGILVGHNQDGTHKSGLVWTLPQINDTSSDHQYLFSVCELTADRTVALPLLTGDDEFVFKAHTQTLTNKTLTSPTINTPTIATPAITNGTVAGTTISPRYVGIQVLDASLNTSTGDGKAYFRVPAILNGMNLTGVAATVYTAGTTNTTDIQIRNKTDSVDMLSTKLTIDSGETDSSTAATAAVIDATKDDVVTGDVLAIDVDAVSTTPAKGLFVELKFETP